MRIKVLEVGSTETKKSAKGTAYSIFTLKYEADNKARERKLVSFKKEVYNVLHSATPGEQYEIELVKDGENWDWVKATRVADSSGDAPKAAAGRSGGNWETPEERAMRQLYIARQSSIAQAVAYCDSEATVEQVLEVAQKFVDFVFADSDLDEDEPSIE